MINLDLDLARLILEKSLYIRAVELCLAGGREKGFVRGPVHLAVGQELTGAVLGSILVQGDKLFGGHRSHSQILGLGVDLKEFFLEVLADPRGLVGGRGGSMHLADESIGFWGSVPIVAGTVPMAVGAALSHKVNKTNSFGVAVFGDGAMEEGVIFESLNLAKQWDLPALFVCENNFYASHMHVSQRQKGLDISRLVQVIGVRSVRVDTRDPFDMVVTMETEIDRARKSCSPLFIEVCCYRWLGHVDWREDVDVGITRSKSEIDYWKNNCGVSRLAKYISENDRSFQIADVSREIEQNVNKVWAECVEIARECVNGDF